MTLGWVYLFMGVLIGSAVIPVALAVTWKRVSAEGMIFGPIFGTVSGIAAWLMVAALYPGGLSDFLNNTGGSVFGFSLSASLIITDFQNIVRAGRVRVRGCMRVCRLFHTGTRIRSASVCKHFKLILIISRVHKKQ